MDFLTFRFLDALDIFIVALLMFQTYRLIRGTAAMNIFTGIFIVYAVWLVVKALHMQLLASILGQIIGVGVIAIIIVFQQEIRRFLMLFGKSKVTSKKFWMSDLFDITLPPPSTPEIEQITQALCNMSRDKVGALIVLARTASINQFTQTGVVINGVISSPLIESIFFKNNPLHDGAVIISGSTITAARCILPTSVAIDLPQEFGMRHRAAIAMTEETDTLVLVVSEESGNISISQGGIMARIHDTSRLSEAIISRLSQN